MANPLVSNTILMGIPPKQMYQLLKGTQIAIVKTMLAKATEPPYTIYLYVNGTKKTKAVNKKKFPAEVLYTMKNISAENIEFGCPYDETTDSLCPGGTVLNGTILVKCKCSRYEILRCTDSERNKYSGDVGQTPNQLLDMCNCKDMSVWYLDDIEILNEPKKLADFGLIKPPQGWCYLSEDVHA